MFMRAKPDEVTGRTRRQAGFDVGEEGTEGAAGKWILAGAVLGLLATGGWLLARRSRGSAEETAERGTIFDHPPEKRRGEIEWWQESGDDDEADRVQEASEDSFPASDAPGWTGARMGRKDRS